MDINCTYSCKHQSEGKCFLKELPTSVSVNNSSSDVNCIYYEEENSRANA